MHAHARTQACTRAHTRTHTHSWVCSHRILHVYIPCLFCFVPTSARVSTQTYGSGWDTQLYQTFTVTYCNATDSWWGSFTHGRILLHFEKEKVISIGSLNMFQCFYWGDPLRGQGELMWERGVNTEREEEDRERGGDWEREGRFALQLLAKCWTRKRDDEEESCVRYSELTESLLKWFHREPHRGAGKDDQSGSEYQRGH